MQKYSHLPDVKRIHKARRVPKFIKKETEQAMVQKEKRRRKETNVIKHSKQGTHKYTHEKGKVVVTIRLLINMLLRFERDERCLCRMFASSNACSSACDPKRKTRGSSGRTSAWRLSTTGLWLKLKLAKSI